jgi:predicted PurR-regulated permease PerM
MALLQDSVSDIHVRSRSNASQRIIAGGIVIAFCFWASSVIMTVLLSVLLAYFLDPIVEALERLRVPRFAGALVAVLLSLALLVGLGWMIWDRAESFTADWPRYREPLKKYADEIERRLQTLEKGFSDITPAQQNPRPTAATSVRIDEGRSIRSLLLTGLGSLYSILLAATFVPFLVFFMLAGKRDVWHGTMQLFPSAERTRVKNTIDDISVMLRSYVAGNAIVAAILVFFSWVFFLAIGLDYPFLMALISGSLNMVPYLGVGMAILPPVVIGLTKYSFYELLGIAGVLGLFHLIAGNVLVPALVGRKVHLNALAVTLSLLFWGWMWGGIGFILAIPITATCKVVCDRVDRWQPIGRWLGA